MQVRHIPLVVVAAMLASAGTLAETLGAQSEAGRFAFRPGQRLSVTTFRTIEPSGHASDRNDTADREPSARGAADHVTALALLGIALFVDAFWHARHM